MSRFFWPAVILCIILFAACGEDDEDSGGDGNSGLRVVTTLPLFADLIENVGGDSVDVTALLPSGADPHTFEPAPRDVAVLENADIVFVNGRDLEPAALNVIEPNLPEGVPLVGLAEEAEAAGVEVRAGDPHLWMNPDNAMIYAQVIRDQLALLDAENAAAYEANYDAYAATLSDLGEEMVVTVEAAAAENRKLITTHDAFGYLAEFLGFAITAFVAEGPGQDASPSDIAAIVEAIEDGGVPAVFTEPQISGESETLEQAAADAGAEICRLYSDAFDDEVTTYEEMMRFNADELARCLGGAE